MIVAAAIGYAAFCVLEPDGVMRGLVGVSGVCGGAMGILAHRQLFLPWRARYDFARYPLAQLERTYALTAEGLCMTARNGETQLFWRDLIGWRRNASTTLLYASPRTFFVAPARLADHGFPYAELQQRLTENVKLRV